MPITVACPSCGKKLTAPDSAAGKKAKCPSCGGLMMLPKPVQDAEPFSQEPLGGPPAGGGLNDLLDEADQMYSVQGKAGGTGPAPNGGMPPMTASDSGMPRRPCPACGEMIVSTALKCRFCGEVFDPSLKKKKRRGSYSADDEDLTTGDWVIAILCSGIGCIVGIVWMIQGKPKGGKMLGVSLGMQAFWFVVRVVLEIVAKQAGG